MEPTQIVVKIWDRNTRYAWEIFILSSLILVVRPLWRFTLSNQDFSNSRPWWEIRTHNGMGSTISSIAEFSSKMYEPLASVVHGRAEQYPSPT